MDRREFLIRLARFVGLPASLGTAAILTKYLNLSLEVNNPQIDNNKTLIKALRDRRNFQVHAAGELQSEKLLHAFHDAPSGTIMMYYQLFWPLFIRPNELEIVQNLEHITQAQEVRKHEFKRWFRVLVLPAVAAAHSLSSTSGEEAEYLQNLIRKIHNRAVQQDPNRDVIETIWVNMTASLIRNESSWQLFSAGKLVEDAEALCHLCLDSPNNVLLAATIAAWQFLLSYERALEARGNKTELLSLKSSMDRVGRHQGQHSPWLKHLAQIYMSHKSFNEMIPQAYEAILGRKYLGAKFEEASRLFTLVRLQNVYNNFLISEGQLTSDYMKPDRARDAVAGAFTLFATYGFSRQEWIDLKGWSEKSQLPLHRDSIRFCDDTAFSAGGLLELQASEFEQGNTAEIAKWTPFRRIEDEHMAYVAYADEGLEKSEHIANLIENKKFAWERVVAFAALTEAKHRGLPGQTQALLDEIAAEVEPKLEELGETYRLEAEFIREEAQQFLGKTLIPVGTSPAGMVRPGLPDLQEDKIMHHEGVKTLDCSFCSLLNSRSKEIQKVYEDEKTYAFLDDYPLAEGHTLVVLKAHHPDLSSLDPAAAGQLGETVARLSKALKEALGAQYIYVASLGEQVKHVHYHLVPRYEGDKKGFVHFISQRGELKDADLLASRIRGEVERFRA